MHGEKEQFRIVRSSATFGTRQSQCPAKHPPATVTPSVDVLSAVFMLDRKTVKSVPSGADPNPVDDHMYTSLTFVTVFFSHISPVWVSVIVSLPLSTKRGVGACKSAQTQFVPLNTGTW